jgi:hypothetical protein
VTALLVIAWGLTGQIYMSRGAADESRHYLAHFPLVPPNLIDQVTHGQGVTYLGQQIIDPNGIHLLEFWNRSIKNVWSLDGSAPGPGPSLSPDLARADGTLRPRPPTPYALTDNGVLLDGEPILVVPATNLRLYKLGRTWRLRAYQAGISNDGWMSLDSAYSRFVAAKHGTLRLTLSRTNFCPAEKAPPVGKAVVLVGTVHVNANHQPELAKSARRLVVPVPNCKQVIVPIPVGAPPWRVQVHFDELFRPSDYGYPDGRQLGAQVNYTYKPG